jgi:hypothetical protein
LPGIFHYKFIIYRIDVIMAITATQKGILNMRRLRCATTLVTVSSLFFVSMSTGVFAQQIPGCHKALCLSQLTSLKNTGQFNKTGYYHDHLLYQVAVTKGDHYKSLLGQPQLVIPKNAPISLLHTKCHDQTCIYTLQNNHTENNSHALFTTVNLQAKAVSPYHLKQFAQSNNFQLVLPNLETCNYQNKQRKIVSGVRLNSGELPAYEGGKALTNAEYTYSAMNQLYPVPLNGYHITDHVITITTNAVPYLFSKPNPATGVKGPNAGIPGPDAKPAGSALDQTNCAAALAQYNSQIGTGKFVQPYPVTPSPDQQTCYDDKQIRYVHYAVPDGPPPSKNGWPVVIMLHGYTDQSVAGYYLTTADAENKKLLPGTPFENTFLNGWDWTKWELDGGKDFDYESYNYYVRMRLEQAWLSRGYAVIAPSTWNAGAFDSWSYEPGYDQPWPYNTDPAKDPYIWPKSDVNSTITYLNRSYWPGFDKQFFVTLMSQIMSNQFDPNNPNSKMDANNLFLMGYSAGSNMVSRLMNEFPSMTLNDTAKTPFPKIKGAIILSGGSYACYDDADGPGKNLCPENTMEQIYNSTATIVNHPPTLVAQSLWDTNAGTYNTKLASTSYYNSYLNFCPVGSSCQPVSGGPDALNAPYAPQNTIQIIHTNNNRIIHSYFPEMIIPSLNLLLDNTCIQAGS